MNIGTALGNGSTARRRQPQPGIDACQLAPFYTPELRFPPTFKVVRGTSAVEYQLKRVPSYTDRVLYRSLLDSDLLCLCLYISRCLITCGGDRNTFALIAQHRNCPTGLAT